MADTATPHLSLTIETTPEQVYIQVADSGPGIAESQISRVFEPFFTTKSTGSGLGLGLSISGRIIDDLGGRIEAGNAPGGGALFTITLPRDPGPKARRATEEPSTHA